MRCPLAFRLAATFAVAAALGLVLPATLAEETPALKSVVRHAKPAEAAKLLATNQILVLDIRTPNEFASGHIAGATNINYLSSDFPDRLAQLDRSKIYLLHCAVGGRSTNALPKLARLGFTNVIHLDGGFKAWQAAGNPVVKP